MGIRFKKLKKTGNSSGKGSSSGEQLKNSPAELYKNSSVFVVTYFAGGVKPTSVFRIL